MSILESVIAGYVIISSYQCWSLGVEGQNIPCSELLNFGVTLARHASCSLSAVLSYVLGKVGSYC